MKTLEQILKEIKSGSVSKNSIQQMGEMIQAILDQSKKSVGLDSDKFSATALGAIIDSKIKLLEEERSNLEGFVDVDKEIEGLTDEAISELKNRLVAMAEAGEINSEEAQNLKKLYKKYVKLAKAQEKFNQGLEKGNAAAKTLLQATLGLSTEWSFLSDTAGFSGLWKGIKKGMAESLSLTNIMSSIVSKIVERAFEFDKLQADYFKKTGIKREEQDMEKMSENLRGMSSDYMKVAFGANAILQNQFKDYQSLTFDERQAMTETISIMEKRGASQESTVAAMDVLVKAVGFTAEESAQIMTNQIAIAEESMRPVSEQVSEFSQGLTTLARFGKDSVNILNKMKLDANKSNVELRTLLGLSEKADTFEGAAQMAQAFNVAVAGPVGAAIMNPLELVGASMEEKVAVLQRKYKEAGSPTLSPRVLRELSASFQVPENELLKIFNVEAGKLGAKQDDASKAQTTLKEQTDLIAKQAAAQEKINTALVKVTDDIIELIGGKGGILKIIGALVEGLTFIADNIFAITLGLGAIQGIILANSYRGATPLNPEFVSSIPMPGGKAGMLLKGLLVTGAAVGTGVAVDSMMNPTSPGTAPVTPGAGGGTNLTPGGVGDDFKNRGLPKSIGGGGGGMKANLTNDGMRGGGSGGSVMIPPGRSAPAMVSSKYVMPQIDLVHKADKLYFAKNDGELMQRINEAKSKAASNVEKKQPTVIRISKREFREMISEALGDIV